jgi:hypothetical protein
MVHTTQLLTISLRACIITICACLTLSFVWSFAPILGWSYYSYEGIKVACGVEWADRSLNVTSYNMTIFITVFILPLVILIAANAKLILIVSIF